MTFKQPPDPDDVASMLATMKFDCKLGYKEIMEAENAGRAIKRWPLFGHVLAENEKAPPRRPRPGYPSPEDGISDREL
jgi:hypothetical protein